MASAPLAVRRLAIQYERWRLRAALSEGPSMRRFLTGMLGIVAGYVLFAIAGYWAIALSSGNQFDRSLEASMTAAFAIGPAGAAVGLVIGLLVGGKRRGTIV
jgi:hypothetical protein